MRPPAPFVARRATPDDAADVASLLNAFDRAHLDDPDEVDATEVAGWWVGRELDQDTMIVSGPAGLVASGLLKEEGEAVLELDALVHPEAVGRSLGGFLLDWAEDESRRRARPALRTSR